jgi:hypothetical protein
MPRMAFSEYTGSTELVQPHRRSAAIAVHRFIAICPFPQKISPSSYYHGDFERATERSLHQSPPAMIGRCFRCVSSARRAFPSPEKDGTLLGSAKAKEQGRFWIEVSRLARTDAGGPDGFGPVLTCFDCPWLPPVGFNPSGATVASPAPVSRFEARPPIPLGQLSITAPVRRDRRFFCTAPHEPPRRRRRGCDSEASALVSQSCWTISRPSHNLVWLETAPATISRPSENCCLAESAAPFFRKRTLILTAVGA